MWKVFAIANIQRGNWFIKKMYIFQCLQGGKSVIFLLLLRKHILRSAVCLPRVLRRVSPLAVLCLVCASKRMATNGWQTKGWRKCLCCSVCRRRPSPKEQIVVTPSLATVGMETTQLTEENADFASRDRYHQSSLISREQFGKQFQWRTQQKPRHYFKKAFRNANGCHGALWNTCTYRKRTWTVSSIFKACLFMQTRTLLGFKS